MASQKLTALSAITSASTDDLLYVVDDPAGTAASKKITFDNLQKSATVVGKVAITQPATGSTLAVAEGKTATVSNTLTFAGTDGSTVTLGAGGTVLYNGGALGTPSSGTATNLSGTAASLTAGANITITPGAGTITIASGTATFNYVTFTRRVTGSALALSLITQTNPFSLTDFPSGTWATLDSASGFVAATGRYVVPYTGYYNIDVVLNISTTGVASDVTFQIKKNGASIFTSLAFTPGAIEAPIAFSYIDQASNVGDYYEVYYVRGAYTGTMSLNASSSFSVQRIQA